MKKLMMVVVLAALALQSSAQAVNPQTTFSSAVSVNNPSLWLNFNDTTSAFKDSVSGVSMTGTRTIVSTSTHGTIATPSYAVTAGYVVLQNYSLSAGNLTAFSVQFFTAPVAGPYTFVVASGTAPSALTIATSFTVNVSATTAVQTFTAPTNFTAVPITAGEYFGYWASSSQTALGYNPVAGTGFYYVAAASALPSGANSYATAAAPDNLEISTTVTSSTTSNTGTVTPRQPGFDNTNSANYSAGFAYNAWDSAPNATLATIDWTSPWTMLLHVDRLNWDHASPIILASKGDLNGAGINNIWWKLYLQTNAANGAASQLCFARQSPAPYTQTGAAASFVANQTWCTPNYMDAMPNGFNYDLVLEDAGTGATSTLSLWINGLSTTLLGNSASAQGFGGVQVAVTSGGSGYPAMVAYTSTGGGASCSAVGTAYSTSGVLTSITPGASFGCTTSPTIILSAATGTGGVLTATAYPQTMNSTVQPLMVPGFVSNNVNYGPGGLDTTQNPLYVDEFALFPGNLSFGRITNLFYETKFYQGLLYAFTTPPKVVLESCCCGPDFSGDQTMAMVIAAHKAGLIQLIGTVDDDGNPNGLNSVGWWRQMLDEAGLNDVGVSVGPGSPTANTGGCPASSITAYNASTPQNASSYESSVPMYRTILAANPTTPVDILLTQGVNGYVAFLQSPADSISALTGLQLQTQNASNGATVNLFNGNFGITPTQMTYLLNNSGNQAMQFFGGTPASGGPGIYVSRTALDPLYLAAMGTTEDTIAGWTNLEIAQILSPYFWGGVLLSSSGGTGYANQTKFSSTGGGPNCNVAGIMTASGGLPTGFQTAWGATVAASASYAGIGYGCTPASFTATGSGTNLTVSALKSGVLTVGDTIAGPGIPAGTTLVSQTSGTTGGVGVYVTSAATTATSASLTRTPTIVLTAPTGTGVAITPSLTVIPTLYESDPVLVDYPSQWGQVSNTTTLNAPVFTWFQNSLMDPPVNGAPRPY